MANYDNSGGNDEKHIFIHIFLSSSSISTLF